MPQVLKPEVRDRILNAAVVAFATKGYAAATMNDIARSAGVAVANLYRYYANKEELFAAAVPEPLVERFEALLDASVRAHAHKAGLARRADEAAARELLEFWIEHRHAVVILLARADGSIHQSFAERFVARLVTRSLAEIRAAHPGVAVTREARLVLQNIFENTRRMLAAILVSYEDAAAIRRAIAGFRSYQVAGLAAFAEWLVHGTRAPAA